MAFLTEKDRTYRTAEDICAHLGDDYAAYNGAIVPPLFQNSLFVCPTEANGITEKNYEYSRVSNPTLELAERKIAALEGGDGALCFSTGMGAISAAILYYMRAASHAVLVTSVYGGAKSLLTRYLPEKFNTTYTFTDGSLDDIRAAVRPETTLIYIESPSSLVFHMQDIDRITAFAKERGIGTVIDNTYATPLYQQPLKHGADIVCHSATKYLGGHSDIMGGAVIARREIIAQIQGNERCLLGAVMDPHQAWLLSRGLRTLPVRMKQHGENGKKIAAFLEKHPKVRQVNYPGSATYPQKELFEKYMSGTNGLMSIVLNGTAEEANRFVGRLHHFQNGCSWGGFESLALYVGKNGEPLVRLHVGLESPETLIADLAQALEG